MTQKLTKKGIVTDLKTPCVHQRFCADCKYGRIHETGSLIWVSCKLQSNGWKSVSSQCNLSDLDFLKLERRVKE